METNSAQARWPIRELARRAAAALANGASPRSGRVRETPDVRSIRWYATIGLVDKPSQFRGRTALYGARQLRQLVAVKRRQAQGAPLAQIQAELAGLGDARLAEIAAVPPALLGPAGADDAGPSAVAHAETPAVAPAEVEFWKPDAVAPAPPAPALPASAAAPPQLSYGLTIDKAVTVLVTSDRPPRREDADAVQAAAQPLLRALTARGLIQGGDAA